MRQRLPVPLQKSNRDGALGRIRGFSGHIDREQRSLPDNRSDFDPVSEHFERTTDDREADAQTVATVGREARERIEDSGQLALGNPDASIEDVDPHFGPFAAAADQNPSSGLCVLDGIGQEIAEDAAEQDRIARHTGVR